MKPKRPIIIADSNIPFLQGVLEYFAEMRYLSATRITSGAVCEADALLIRTRTYCNQALLRGARVRFIATATIGYDHIDTDYCISHGISWENAPGCNANAVAQYIAVALCFWAEKRGKKLSEMTLGIIGVGQVGTRVKRFAELLGMRILLNDPPIEKKGKSDSFVSLETIARESDVITFHTPLTFFGDDSTYHLANADFFAKIVRRPLIINTARGGVVDEEELLKALSVGLVSDCVIDCWEKEPNINRELVARSMLATPHIAGYSIEGKANATEACIRNISRFFGFGIDDYTIELHNRKIVFKENIQSDLLKNYRIDFDSEKLKKMPEFFEEQRSKYQLRQVIEIR